MISSETIQKILEFRDERDWKKYHNPKDLAISLSLESAELLELFQWSGADVVRPEKLEKMREELADVLIYSVLFADSIGADLDEIVLNKLTENGHKYGRHEAYGSNRKYTELKSNDHLSE